MQRVRRPVTPVQCWLTIPEAAKALELKQRQVLALIHHGPLPASVIEGQLRVHSTHLPLAPRVLA